MKSKTALLLATTVATVTALGSVAVNAQMFDELSRSANWSGAYGGIEGGYGWGESRHGDHTGFRSGSFDTSGGLFGITAGYNWQKGTLVYGLEGDMSWANIGGSTPGFNGACSGAMPYCSTELKDLGTVRARIGYALGALMPYATFGLAFGNVYGREGDIPVNGASGFGDTYHAGWSAGVGVEDAIAPRWRLKLEYLYVNLGDGATFTDTFNNGSTAPEDVRFHASLFRAGVSYKF